MDTHWMEQFKGQHVAVLTTSYNEERSDAGTLVNMGDGWLQLVKDNGEMILIPSTAIRIVKLLEMTKRVEGIEAPISNRVYEPNAQTV
jgi:hypothetical protein